VSLLTLAAVTFVAAAVGTWLVLRAAEAFERHHQSKSRGGHSPRRGRGSRRAPLAVGAASGEVPGLAAGRLPAPTDQCSEPGRVIDRAHHDA